MEVTVEKATEEQRLTLRNLLEFYCYDFTEFDDSDIDENGRFEYKFLDYYFVEKDRAAYLVRADGKIAGFILYRTILREETSKEISYVAEFFILKKYRRKGVGKLAAHKLFDSKPGEWMVAQLETNHPAQKFWRKIIGEYTKGNYYEYREPNWNGPIQSFFTPEKPE